MDSGQGLGIEREQRFAIGCWNAIVSSIRTNAHGFYKFQVEYDRIRITRFPHPDKIKSLARNFSHVPPGRIIDTLLLLLLRALASVCRSSNSTREGRKKERKKERKKGMVPIVLKIKINNCKKLLWTGLSKRTRVPSYEIESSSSPSLPLPA